MNTTYTIYFTPKSAEIESRVIELAKQFGSLLQDRGLVAQYQLYRLTDSGNFNELPAFSMINLFDSKKHMDDSMSVIGKELLDDPFHAELMRSVKDFKVTFARLESEAVSF